MFSKSFILSLLLLTSTSWVKAEDGSDVLSLTASTFDSTVSGESLMLVEFFAPWCGHCKALAPKYEEAATILKEESIPLAKVDCVAEAEVCSKFGVSGYPTLKVFRNGDHVPYSGGRKTEDIVSYMKKQALPAVSYLTAETFPAFSTSDRVVIVSFSSEDSAAQKAFKAIADKYREEYLFGIVSDEAIASQEGATLDQTIVLYKTFDEGKNIFEHSSTIDVTEFEAFVQEKSFPLIDQISPDNFSKYADSGLPIAYLFIDPADENKEVLIEELRPVAEKFKGKLNFCWIDAVKFADHAKSLNLQSGVFPSFAIQSISEGTKFPLEGPIDASNIETHSAGVVDGSIAPSIKSEKAPETQDEPVFVLVADEFDKVLFEEGKDKDILVEFYAPWCGHCKKLAPTYTTLGETYAPIKDKLVIAKMDATANDVPPSAGFKVSGFPTIKFKPAGSTSFIDYDGARDYADFVKYLEKNAVNDITLPPPVTNETVEEIVEEVKKEEHKHEEL